MSVVSIESAEHYLWGDGCDGWHLLKDPGLHVIQERVPAGGSERRHRHATARQFFFILRGRAVMELEGLAFELAPGQGIQVPPGQAHRFRNPFPEPVDFLCVSSPTTRGDRVDLE